MNHLALTARLVAAAAAATLTLSLFGWVVSIAEPQQSVLMAKTRHIDTTTPADSATIAVALNDAAASRNR